MKHGQADRRIGALKRLLKQMESGEKTKKKSTEKIPLTEKDRDRIAKEISGLRKKV